MKNCQGELLSETNNQKSSAQILITGYWLRQAICQFNFDKINQLITFDSDFFCNKYV